MAITKAEAARALAEAHFGIEEGLERVFIIRTDLDDPRELINCSKSTRTRFLQQASIPFRSLTEAAGRPGDHLAAGPISIG